MKLTMIHKIELPDGGYDQQYDVFENVLYIEIDNQEDIGNGIWLNVQTCNKEFKDFSIEFDPKYDTFFITK